MKLYLIRHATPELEKYHNLPPGPPLGSKGKEEAQKIAVWLSRKEIQRVVCSDFLRVQETVLPFIQVSPAKLKIETHVALRERDTSLEEHISLVRRVREWLDDNLGQIQTVPHAIFSHCGPINMLLEALDPQGNILQYPFKCPFGCLTPKAGIWELDVLNGKINNGQLIIL
jgi:2,3-bisphosphoglycerate-dependent phosphoglycerate mutase